MNGFLGNEEGVEVVDVLRIERTNVRLQAQGVLDVPIARARVLKLGQE